MTMMMTYGTPLCQHHHLHYYVHLNTYLYVHLMLILYPFLSFNGYACSTHKPIFITLVSPTPFYISHAGILQNTHGILSTSPYMQDFSFHS